MSGGESARFLCFLAVGGASTALHFAVLVLAVELGGVSAVTGTILGFLAGAAANYGLNRRLTFASRRRHAECLPRFGVMLGLGLGSNTALLAGGVALGLHYLFAQCLATGVVLVQNFLLLRGWVFREAGREAVQP